MTLYCIIADGEFDQVCCSYLEAHRERRDLQAMGCTVRIREVSSWDEANALEERMRGY